MLSKLSPKLSRTFSLDFNSFRNHSRSLHFIVIEQTRSSNFNDNTPFYDSANRTVTIVQKGAVSAYRRAQLCTALPHIYSYSTRGIIRRGAWAPDRRQMPGSRLICYAKRRRLYPLAYQEAAKVTIELAQAGGGVDCRSLQQLFNLF